MQYLGDYQGLPLDVWDGNTSVKFINPFGNNDRYYGTDDNAMKIVNSYVDKAFNYSWRNADILFARKISVRYKPANA